MDIAQDEQFFPTRVQNIAHPLIMKSDLGGVHGDFLLRDGNHIDSDMDGIDLTVIPRILQANQLTIGRTSVISTLI